MPHKLVREIGYPHANTIAGVLFQRACTQPQQLAFRFVRKAEPDVDVSYIALWREVALFAGMVLANGWAGCRIIVALPPGRSYVVSLFGCMAAGATAVPAYPPS